MLMRMLILAYRQCNCTNVIALGRVYDGCRNPPFFFLLVATGWFYIASKGERAYKHIQEAKMPT